MPMRSGRTGHFNYPLPGLGYGLAAALLLFFTAFSAVAAAQTTWCRVEYSGQQHSQEWMYYTLDARYEGLAKITVYSDGVLVYICGHDGAKDDMYYCGGDAAHEWVTICCRDDDNDGNGTAHK